MGDKELKLDEIGRSCYENIANTAFKNVEEAFQGAALEAGFISEEQLQEYMKEIRKEVSVY
jgi:hypothetical protein